MNGRVSLESRELILDDITALLKRLGESRYVDGIALIGSAGEGRLRSESDYDVLIVLDQPPVPIRTGVTWVDGRLADLVFSSLAEIDGLATVNGGDTGGSGSGVVDEIGQSIVVWMRVARIVHDRVGRLGRLVERVVATDDGPGGPSIGLSSIRLRRLDRASYNLA